MVGATGALTAIMGHQAITTGKVVEFTRDGKPAMLHTWQTEAQQAWEQAYAKVTGGNAKLAWESVTTSKHLESYRDTAWLGKDKSKVSKAWGQQAADVVRHDAIFAIGLAVRMLAKPAFRLGPTA